MFSCPLRFMARVKQWRKPYAESYEKCRMKQAYSALLKLPGKTDILYKVHTQYLVSEELFLITLKKISLNEL